MFAARSCAAAKGATALRCGSLRTHRAYHALHHSDGAQVLPDTVDRDGSLFQKTASKSLARVAELRAKIATIELGGGEAARARHTSRKKMLPRARVEGLLDSQSPFIELSQLAGHDMYGEEKVPAGGLVTGIGIVSGKPCMIVANDATVKGGTYYPITVKKHLRAQEIASTLSLPCIYLVDSGGANLPRQADVFPDKEHFGRIFFNQANMSRRGIPQIAAVMGSCTAGGAYVPAMADENVIVANQGTIFLAGPPLVKAATGEVVTAEELGGGMMHSSVSGVTDHLASNDAHALSITRRIVSRLETSSKFAPAKKFEAPLYNEHDLYGLATDDMRHAIDVRQVIARLVDGSRLAEFKARFGETLVTGFAHIHGYPVGLIGNNGVLFGDAALKGAHFIQLCVQRKLPIVFLQNISGFMVGSAAERAGIAKHGAKLVNAVANAAVPKFTVVVGGSYGAGNYGMCGRAYAPTMLWTWPNGRTGVMGGEQAADVLVQVKQGTRGASSEDETFRAATRAQFEAEAQAEYSSARLWDDGVIDPLQTRPVLGFALQLADQQKSATHHDYGVFRM